MKFFLAVLLLTFTALACKNAASKGDKKVDMLAVAMDTAAYTTIEWVDTLKDFGAINFGEIAPITFRFKNTGAYPLFVIDAVPGCGCTVTDYPKQAIAPGKESLITAVFDTKKGSEGEFKKVITVTTNTKGSTSRVLYFMGTIIKRPAKDTLANNNKGALPKPARLLKKLKIS